MKQCDICGKPATRLLCDECKSSSTKSPYKKEKLTPAQRARMTAKKKFLKYYR